MILSASRRTDIPCHYGEWFLNRLQAGYVLVRNPMNHSQLKRIPLSPDIVDCIVFWTKDAGNFLQYVDTIGNMNYQYYFQFTVTPYDKKIEKGLRSKGEIVETFRALSRRVGKNRVLWRYDPILLGGEITVKYHKEQFLRLCKTLSPYTESVTISFVDDYAKQSGVFWRAPQGGEIDELAAFIGKTAKEFGLTPKACCERMNLTKYDIFPASCIDKSVIEALCRCELRLSRDKNQRPGCGCVESVDIGAYNTCPNGCVYCYANRSAQSSVRNFSKHDPAALLLLGAPALGESVVQLQAKSNRLLQTRLF